MAKFNNEMPFGTVHGGPATYAQDGKYFNSLGEELNLETGEVVTEEVVTGAEEVVVEPKTKKKVTKATATDDLI
jgi:hypothetical protein